MSNKVIHSPQKISAYRLLIESVWPFILIIFILLFSTLASLEIMSSVRAYVGAESLYSKSQKQAYFSLTDYIRSQQQSDYDEFLYQISIPLGDTKARLALQAEIPDIQAAYEGFLQANNSPNDAEKMVFLFYYFANTAIMREPIKIWTAADYYILKTQRIGKEIHKNIKNQNLTDSESSEYLQTLERLNEAGNHLQKAFSDSLARTSSKIELILFSLLISLTLVMVSLGLLFSKRLVNQRVLSTQALESEAKKNLALLRNASDGVHILNQQGELIEASDSFCRMLGYSRDEIIGMKIFQWDSKFKKEEIDKLLTEYLTINSRIEFETIHQTKNGETFDVEISVFNIVLENQILLFCSSRDISERKINEKQVQYLAYHDHLTGLPNRAMFKNLLNDAIKSSLQTKQIGAVLFVDIDNFKSINDVYGHKIGDEVLSIVAKRLAKMLEDNQSVCRIGGDEFVILMPDNGIDEAETQVQVANHGEQIRRCIEKPMRLNNRDYLITVSIGVSLFPKDGISEENILQEADIAMYIAKQGGRNTLKFFAPDMQESIKERFSLEKYLRYALAKNELQIYVQSQVDKDANVIGGECLIRWNHPTKGLVSPLTFIPIAEESNQILVIGEWVLTEACKMLAFLNKHKRPLRLSVNVSPKQFQQENFAEIVKNILNKTQAPAELLTIEITENLLLNNTSDVVETMLSLSSLGIRFSIDDFGTGYSSLSYLKSLPLHELKIDKSFIQYLPSDENDQALIKTILSVAHHLNLLIVAEGVETYEQHDLLIALGCNFSQGFYFAKPIEASQWIESQTSTSFI